jgi:accessory gene regulator B
VYGIFDKTLDLGEVDGIKLKYMLELIINDMLKIIIMFIGFSLLGEGLAFIYCLVSLMLIRCFSGGLHLKTFSGCLIFTTCFLSICIFLHHHIFITLPLLIGLFFFNMFIMVLLTPITPKQRPKYSEKKMLQFKFISIMVVVVNFTFYYVTGNSTYFAYAVWVITLQSIQLLIALGGITYEHKTKIKNATSNDL